MHIRFGLNSGPGTLKDTGSAMTLLVGHDEYVAQWVGKRVGINYFGPCVTFGVVRDDVLICGVVYNNFRGTDIEVTVVSATPRSCTRAVLRGVFWYPFNQLRVTRLTARTAVTNWRARTSLCRLGFQQEGVMRRGLHTGADAAIYGMLREECRWIEAKHRNV